MAVKLKQHKGKWWVFIDHKGKRKAKCVGSKQAAETAAKKIEAKLTLGDFTLLDDKPQRPFDAYFRNWLDTYVKAHCKERTYDVYALMFRLYLQPRLGHKDIADIIREDVKKLTYELLAQGKSRSTVKLVLVPLNEMFNHAIEDGHVTANPARRILRRTRAEEGDRQEDIHFLTHNEVVLLLETCQRHFPAHYPLVLLLARTGLRIGEALALQWGDMDVAGRFIEVRRTWSAGRLTTPKGSRRRRVDMSRQLTETLKALLLERKKDTLQNGWGEVPPWVFPSAAGTLIKPSNFRDRTWAKLLAKAGLRQIRIHDLRHTFASLLIQHGESLAYVKEQMGHHSITITVDVYGHLVPGGNKAAVDRLDDPSTASPATIRNLRLRGASEEGGKPLTDKGKDAKRSHLRSQLDTKASMMSDRAETATVPHEGTFRRELGLIDASAIVAGSMIGSGIFIVSADVARTVNSPGWLLLVWLFDAGLTLTGALAYGELAAMMPRAGGQYIYLREAYSPLLGFLYGWTLFLVIQSGTIAAVAVAFAKFLGVWVPWVSAQSTLAQLGPVSLSTQRLVAIAVIALLTWSNSRGVREGKIIQNLFTFAKVAVLVTLIGLGLFFARKTAAVTANLQNLWGETPLSLGFLMLMGGAMVGPLFSSDAWNNVTFTAGEVKNPRRTLPLSLLGGTGVVMLLYCLTNVAYLCLLPLAGSATGETVMARGMQYATEDRVATAAAYMIFGPSAASIMAGAIMVSTFGCLNGLILAGPRLYYAMARDRLFFARTGHLNEAGVPAGGLWLQMAWASLLTLSGTYGNLLDYVVFAALLFYMLTVAGLFILRRTRPDAERPYRVSGYPWLPAFYVLAASVLMLDLLLIKPTYTWPGLLIVFTGVPIYFLWQHRSA